MTIKAFQKWLTEELIKQKMCPDYSHGNLADCQAAVMGISMARAGFLAMRYDDVLRMLENFDMYRAVHGSASPKWKAENFMLEIGVL